MVLHSSRLAPVETDSSEAPALETWSTYPANILQMDIPSSISTGEVSSTSRRHSGASAQQSPQVRCSRLLVRKLEPVFRPTRNRRSSTASSTLRIRPRLMAPNECSLRGPSTGRFPDSRLSCSVSENSRLRFCFSVRYSGSSSS